MTTQHNMPPLPRKARPISLEDDVLDASHGPTRLLLLAEYWKREAVKARSALVEKVRELEAEVLTLHAKLAHETLRADQGWQRYESANADRNSLRALAAARQPVEAEPVGDYVAAYGKWMHDTSAAPHADDRRNQFDAFKAGYLAAQQPATVCRHRIADGRNPVVKSGYLCVDCGALFAAADHDGSKPATVDRDADEAEEDAYVIDRMGKLLAGVAVALKGPEEARKRHGYQDLPELAAKMALELAIFRERGSATPPAGEARDAARYRHLRDCNSGSLVIVQIFGMGDDEQAVLTEEDADAAIDAALSQQERKEGGERIEHGQRTEGE